jgi:hypothetical protein
MPLSGYEGTATLFGNRRLSCIDALFQFLISKQTFDRCSHSISSTWLVNECDADWKHEASLFFLNCDLVDLKKFRSFFTTVSDLIDNDSEFEICVQNMWLSSIRQIENDAMHFAENDEIAQNVVRYWQGIAPSPIARPTSGNTILLHKHGKNARKERNRGRSTALKRKSKDSNSWQNRKANHGTLNPTDISGCEETNRANDLKRGMSNVHVPKWYNFIGTRSPDSTCPKTRKRHSKSPNRRTSER